MLFEQEYWQSFAEVRLGSVGIDLTATIWEPAVCGEILLILADAMFTNQSHIATALRCFVKTFPRVGKHGRIYVTATARRIDLRKSLLRADGRKKEGGRPSIQTHAERQPNIQRF